MSEIVPFLRAKSQWSMPRKQHLRGDVVVNSGDHRVHVGAEAAEVGRFPFVFHLEALGGDEDFVDAI